MTAPVALASSGGKDSVLALAALRTRGEWAVQVLVATVTDTERLVAAHEVPARLVASQASSLGVPLLEIPVPREAPNAVYESRLQAALVPLRARGIRHIAFGDVFLQDVKAYRDALMARLGFETVYPLWGADTSVLAQAFVRDGYRAVTVCVDGGQLGEEWAGRELDAAFLAALPPGVDPCGENGEFHTFVSDGPGFAYRVPFERAPTRRRGAFHYAPLVPVSDDRCARCGAPFECGMSAGAERCWCADRPPVAIDPSLGGCLCPRCLAGLARARHAAP